MKLDIAQSAGAIIAARHEPEGVRILANLYWRTLLVAFLLIVTGVLMYGISGLLRVLNDLNGTTSVSASPPSALNRATLNATIRNFENRRLHFDLLKTTGREVIPDPSR
jgi:hypothetical protein